jgi:predicted RNA-binding Zn ribbon-like protein
MRASGSPAATMKLVGGDPGLDFVNTVGGRLRHRRGPVVLADKLSGYDDLVAWSRHAGLLGAADARRLERGAQRRPREAAAVLARARAFREALYQVLTSLMTGRHPKRGNLARVNVEIGAARRREALRPDGETLRWGWVDASGRLESVLWPVARASAALLTSDLGRLRQCGGERCGWLFLDRSRNRSRQWCTMEDCGNLAKVRRFRKRHPRPRAARS